MLRQSHLTFASLFQSTPPTPKQGMTVCILNSLFYAQLAEIELMHELDHPNIVKYYDTVKTKNFLYIVLE